MDDACHATDSGISEAVNSRLRVEGDRTTTGPTISGIALATRNRWPASSKLGLFEDPQYIRGASTDMHRERQNVAILAVSVSASLLTQFVSLMVAPAGIGSPGPPWYALSTHTLEHLDIPVKTQCPVETQTTAGDNRIPLTGPHGAARAIQEERHTRQSRPIIRLRRKLAGLADWLANR